MQSIIPTNVCNLLFNQIYYLSHNATSTNQFVTQCETLLDLCCKDQLELCGCCDPILNQNTHIEDVVCTAYSFVRGLIPIRIQEPPTVK